MWDEKDTEVTIPGVKVRALLAILLINRAQVVSADRLIDGLWGDDAPTDASAVLRTKVTQLRRVIDQAGGDGRSVVTWRSPGYVLDVPPESVDYEEFTAAMRAAREQTDPQSQVEFYSSALTTWRGEALGEFRDHMFSKAHVVHLDELWIEAIEARVEARLALGDSSRVISELEHLRDQFPWRENVHSLLMRALYHAGRQQEALAVYSQVTSHLRDELGLDPSPHIAQLYQSILRQDMPASSPPSVPPTEPARSGNVPQPLTDIVGRDEELREVHKLLSDHRLLTIFGPGGVGKTRLSIEIGHDVEADFPDGVWFVDLSSIVNFGERQERSEHQDYSVLSAIASALNLRDDSATGANELNEAVSLQGRITNYLMTHRALLIVDNAEHVLESVATAVRSIMANAADVRFLVTSREPFRAPFEKLYPLSPLEVPQPSTATDISDIDRFHALSLFFRRCADAGADIEPTPENVSLASTVCIQLDGLPLALELAAAKVPVLGLTQLLQRLDDRLRILRSPRSGAQQRHRTLQAVIGWSWEMLSQPQQVLLRRLSLSAGGYTLEAVEDIAAFGELDVDDMVDLLTRLADQSLVSVHTGAGHVRYRLLQSVSLYAYERLKESGEDATIAHRHLDHFGRKLSLSTRQLRTEQQANSLRALASDIDNIRLSVCVAHTYSSPEKLLRLVSDSTWFRFLRGNLTEAHRALEEALTQARQQGFQGPELTEALLWNAALYLRITETRARLDTIDFATLLRHQSTDTPRVRRARWFLAYSLVAARNRLTSENVPQKHVLTALTAVGDDDTWGSAAATTARSLHAFLNEDFDQARTLAGLAAEEFSRLGDNWGWLQANDVLSRIAERESDFVTSRALDEKALHTAEALDLTSEFSRLLGKMGIAALVTGHQQEAREWFQRSRRLAGEQCDSDVCGMASTGLRVVDLGITGPDVLEAMHREYIPFDPSLDFSDEPVSITPQQTE